jgi:glycosyltransferase involved in cell wall biosynthesis
MNKKFTIFSSTYNKSSYLMKWAQSISVQRYRPLSVLLVDDCSSDSTRDIMPEIKKLFLINNIEFRIIYNKNRLYCGSSYKHGATYLEGGYVGVLDADDMLTEDAVESVVHIYKKYPEVDWLYTQFDIYDDQLKRRKRIGFNICPKENESLLDLGIRGVHGYGHWRTFDNDKIKRADKLYPEGLTCSVDKYMGYRLEEFGQGGFFNEVCYKHRQHPRGSKNSVSSTKFAMDMWRKVVKKAQKRRELYNYEPKNIIKMI